MTLSVVALSALMVMVAGCTREEKEVRGWVYALSDTLPVANARVMLNRPHSRIWKTDSTGRFLMHLRPERMDSLVISAPSKIKQRLPLRAFMEDSLVVYLENAPETLYTALGPIPLTRVKKNPNIRPKQLSKNEILEIVRNRYPRARILYVEFVRVPPPADDYWIIDIEDGRYVDELLLDARTARQINPDGK
ncbi:MAG: hypothetical protein GXO82_04825 [Chlorobi bacterium]|nr:hypothetical protein [Chlorobiota bacterium]